MLMEMGSIIAYESDVFTFFHLYLWKLKKKKKLQVLLGRIQSCELQIACWNAPTLSHGDSNWLHVISPFVDFTSIKPLRKCYLLSFLDYI